MKVMYCTTMTGRTEESIKFEIDKMTNVIKSVMLSLDLVKCIDDVEVVHNHTGVGELDYDHYDIKCGDAFLLGKGLMEKLSKSDLVVFGNITDSFGCHIEKQVCVHYKIKHISIDELIKMGEFVKLFKN